MKTLNFKSKEAHKSWINNKNKMGLLKMRPILKIKNKRGQQIMVNLMMAFLAVTFLIMFVPGFVELINMGKSSTGLNCVGYVDSNLADGNQSYNASIGTQSTIGCLSLSFYIPYIVIAVLIASVGKIFMDRRPGQEQQYYGG